MFWVVVSTVFAAALATSVAIMRIKLAKKPTSKLGIILPPIFMSTGALMFIFPIFRISWLQASEALIIGALFSILLIRTSQMEIRDNDIFLKPSKTFVFILFGLLIIRIIGKVIIGNKISVAETGSIFYLLAFGMIFSWRLVMLYKYHQLEKELLEKRATTNRN